MARSLAPYIHVILADVSFITWYIDKPLVRLTTAHYQSAVSTISFAQVLTAQWSDTIPCRNVRFQVGITSLDIPFQQPGEPAESPLPSSWTSKWHSPIQSKSGYSTTWGHTVDEPPHQIRSYTLLFRFSFTFPTSPIHPYAPPLRRDRARAHT